MSALVRGRRIGIDVGSVRIGVALSDPDGVLATPLTTLRRDAQGAELLDLLALVREHEVVEVIVGLPRSLSGSLGPAAREAQAYSDRLASRVAPVPVRLADERFTTVVAARTLTQRGVRGKRQRTVIDQAAAVEILQGWLDQHRRSVDRRGTTGAATSPTAAGDDL